MYFFNTYHHQEPFCTLKFPCSTNCRKITIFHQSTSKVGPQQKDLWEWSSLKFLQNPFLPMTSGVMHRRYVYEVLVALKRLDFKSIHSICFAVSRKKKKKGCCFSSHAFQEYLCKWGPVCNTWIHVFMDDVGNRADDTLKCHSHALICHCRSTIKKMCYCRRLVSVSYFCF